MERIQSAIAKARAERRAALARTAAPEAAPSAAPPPPGAPLPDAAVDAAAVAARWAALAGFVPDPQVLERHRILAAAGGRAAAPFDAMRTRLVQQLRGNGWKRVAVTSPTAGCGKTTVALNLAFGLARQAELRVILCELDLRRPTISVAVGLTEALAFARVIEGRAPFADHARRVGDNLALALNRHAARHPSELLQGAAMAEALDRIEADYAPDVMIFDLPPMLVCDDAMAFAGQVDAVLLVAAAEATTVRQIDDCERDLATQTNVMGVVLNKCRYSGPDYGYDYY